MVVPEFSVVVPVFNRPLALRRCLESLFGPSNSDFEIIVVDDGSTDDTLAIAREIAANASRDVQVHSQENAGAASARNLGVSHAKGRFVAFLDSDDVWFDWTPDRISEAIAAHPDAALIFLEGVEFIAERELSNVLEGKSDCVVWDSFLDAVRDNPRRRFGTESAIIRRDLVHEIAGFDTSFGCSEDSDLFLRANASGKCLRLIGAPLLGIEGGRSDGLSGKADCVADGMEKMLRKFEAGTYPGDLENLRSFMAKAVVYSARISFATGRADLAYGAVLKHWRLVRSGGQGHWLLRLLLMPVLSLIRPKSYSYQWRKKQ